MLAGGIRPFELALLQVGHWGTRVGARAACASAATERLIPGRVLIGVRVRPARNPDEPNHQEQAGTYSPEVRKCPHAISVDSKSDVNG